MKTTLRRFLTSALVAWALTLVPTLVSADEPTESISAAHNYFTDVTLVDQNGESLRFYSDLLAGKTVVINSFFASCQGVCPVLSRSLAKVQESLGDRIGEDVVILSITVDAENDTPSVLKEYASRWGARRGWYFLTGEPEDVRTALHKVGQLVEDKESHSSILVVGNEATGLWKKLNGMAPPVDLANIVADVSKDQG